MTNQSPLTRVRDYIRLVDRTVTNRFVLDVNNGHHIKMCYRTNMGTQAIKW